MIIRLWTSTNQRAGLPFSTSVASWWHYCLDCDKLTGPIPGPIGPRGPVSDSDDGVPQEVIDACPAHVCRQKAKQEPQTVGASHRRVWTADEDDLVRSLPPTEAARIIGVSGSSITRRRAHLGMALARKNGDQWTPEQDAIVIGQGCTEAAAALGVTKAVIEWRRKQLRAEGRMQAIRVTRRWTADEDALVLAMPPAESAKITGRAEATIRVRRTRLRAAARAAA